MSSLALLFVGAVLLVNGLVFLGKVDSRAAVPINLLAGSYLVLAALLQVFEVSAVDPDARLATFGAVGFSLFGFTYLTVAGNTLVGGSGSALGYYCGWASVIAFVIAMVNFEGSTDPHMAWLWVSWSALFLTFAIALISGSDSLSKAAGVLAIVQSVTTASVPALLMVDAAWSEVNIGIIATAQILGVITYVAAGRLFRSRRAAPGEEGTMVHTA